MEIKKLLVELDPSKDNKPALQRTHAVAAHFGADVEALVWEPSPAIPAPIAMEPGVFMAANQVSDLDFKDWAETEVSSLVDDGVAVSVTVTAEQPRYEGIIARAEECEADLIIRVVGEQGRLKRLFLGATDWDLIRHSKKPLWLVQPDNTDEERANVLAAVDPMHANDTDMKLDRRLLNFGKIVSETVPGTLHVFHAVRHAPAVPVAQYGTLLAEPAPQPDPNLLDKITTAHKAKLDELLKGQDIADDHVHVLAGEPADQINAVIEAHGIGVVVAGAISRSWLDRLIIGSTAESLLDAVNCDLVLLPANS